MQVFFIYFFFLLGSFFFVDILQAEIDFSHLHLLFAIDKTHVIGG